MPDKTHTLAAVSLIRETYTCYSISDPRRLYLLQYTWLDTYSYCSISYPRRLHLLQHLWAKIRTLAATSLSQDTYTCCRISDPRHLHLLQHLWSKTLTLAAASLSQDIYTCCRISDPRRLHLMQYLWSAAQWRRRGRQAKDGAKRRLAPSAAASKDSPDKRAPATCLFPCQYQGQ